MTIGLVAFGPRAGAGVLAALAAVEHVGRGAIGGFVSLAALTEEGRLLRASTQTGGSSGLFGAEAPASIVEAPLVGLISSGPNRPEPLADFVAAEPGIGLVTGHRMPQLRSADGTPLNRMVLNRMKDGAAPQAAIDWVIARHPGYDAGFVALGHDGQIGRGSSPIVTARRDHGTGQVTTETGSVAVIHNAIEPHRLIVPLAQEMAREGMRVDPTPLSWITIPAGIPVGLAAASQISVDPEGTAAHLSCPHPPQQGGPWPFGLGDRIAVICGDRHLGWLGYEPFMVQDGGILQNIDGLAELSLPVFAK